MLQISIVEDDPECRALLQGYIDRYFQGSQDVSVMTYTDGKDFLADEKALPDVVFMDIVMPESNGVEVARQLRKKDDKVQILFVTEMMQYALEGYAVSATDFLVKPLYYTAFCTAMKRVLSLLKRRMPEMLRVSYDKTTSYLDIQTIYYIETDSKKTLIHARSGDYPCMDTMKILEEKLGPHGFARCHQAFLVNLQYVESVEKQSLIVHETLIPVSRYKREDFLQELVRYVGGIM